MTGLAVGAAFIILFSTVGSSASSQYTQHDFTWYDLGKKDELLSNLSEYVASEPDNAVRIGNKYRDPSFYELDLYIYPLIVDYDSKRHDTLWISTYYNETRVHSVSIQWRIQDEPNLVNAIDLMVLGIAEITIPDWQIDDG